MTLVVRGAPFLVDPWLALSVVEGYDPVPVLGLLEPGLDAEQLLLNPPRGLPPRVNHRLASPRLREEVEELELECQRLGLTRLPPGQAPFPPHLAQIAGRPALLFVKGDLRPLRSTSSVAIVGSRTPTPYGMAAAADFATVLAGAGVVVWSGLALGIDGVAHRAALAAGGPTVAVLAGGLDAIEPRAHTGLAEEIVEAGGLLLSEAPPGRRPARGHFPRRNRILAGSVQAVLVIEAGLRSGTLHTARHAADAGIDVYAVPGPYTSERSSGCHALLRDGAFVADRPSALLRDLGIRTRPMEATEDGPSPAEFEARADLAAIASVLATGPRPQNTVLRETGLSESAFTAALVEGLEAGVLLSLDGGMIATTRGVRAGTATRTGP